MATLIHIFVEETIEPHVFQRDTAAQTDMFDVYMWYCGITEGQVGRLQYRLAASYGIIIIYIDVLVHSSRENEKNGPVWYFHLNTPLFSFFFFTVPLRSASFWL